MMDISPQKSNEEPQTAECKQESQNIRSRTKDLADSLQSIGFPTMLGDEDDAIWTVFTRSSLVRLPLECTSPISSDFTKKAFSMAKIKMVNYILPESDKHPANCFDYICANPEYDVQKLDSKGRRDVRRGLRRCEIRKCDWDEILAGGVTAYADTSCRHGYKHDAEKELQALIEQHRRCPFFEVWGAWQDTSLVAWMLILKTDNWAYYSKACSRQDSLSDCPNNALVYEVTRHLIEENNNRIISYGISSSLEPNVLSLHKFKLRMGFEARRVHRRVVPHWLLRPILSSNMVSMMWQWISAKYPSSATLSHLANLSRMVSGGPGDPLSWVDEN